MFKQSQLIFQLFRIKQDTYQNDNSALILVVSVEKFVLLRNTLLCPKKKDL